jgi:predicted DNA-binding transcriptional regulator YafY
MERCASAAGLRFVPREPPARDLATYVTKSGVNARCRARVKVFAPAEVIARRLPPHFGLLEPIDQKSCFFETGASTYESVAMQLSLVGADFEIIEPPELVEEVRRLAERYRRAAG